MFNPIPTIYKNIQFRSRLEATWAAYFDLLKWKWEYEPCDFKGWIPDFVLYGSQLVYVEVKPICTFQQDIASEIDRSGCNDEVLMVGMSGIIYEPGSLDLGWLRGTYKEFLNTEVDCFDWDKANYGRWSGSESEEKNPDNIIGFCHATGSYHDRITGCYDGGCSGDGTLERDEIEHLWAQAKNKSQWKPPKKTQRNQIDKNYIRYLISDEYLMGYDYEEDKRYE